MKALVYTGTRQVEYRDEPDPRLAPGEVVLRIDAVGICGSDMHAYHGHDPRRVPPLILGHELAGEIVEGPAKGMRVTANPLIACGRCENCLQGRGNLCSDRAMVGMGAAVARDVPPFAKVLGVPLRLRGINAVGMRRAGLPVETIAAVEARYAAGRLDLDGIPGIAGPADWWAGLADLSPVRVEWAGPTGHGA